MISFTVILFFESGSSNFRRNDSASVSNLLHGVSVNQELSPFHLTNSAQPVVGSSQGNSIRCTKNTDCKCKEKEKKRKKKHKHYYRLQ